MRIKSMKNITKNCLPVIISILLIISFIGECSGLDLLSKVDGTSTNDAPSGNIIPSGDDSSYSIPKDDQKTEPPASVDDGNDFVSDDNDENSDTDSTLIENNPDSSTSSSDTNTYENDSVVNDTENSTNLNTENNTVNTYTIDQLKDKIEIDYENLEYWLEKLNFSDIDENLKVRLLELAKKSTFIYEIKLKIMNLINDNTLTHDEKKTVFLKYIKSVCLNERDVSSNEIVSKIEKHHDQVNLGKSTLFNIEDSSNSVGVEKVHFVAERDLSNVKVAIIKLKQKPEDIPLKLRKNETVYHYLDIKLTENDEYINEDDIKTLNFTFNVNVSWILGENIDRNTVILIRYHDGEWQNLTTNLVSENETHITYVAETAGCSTFAVVGSTLVEISDPYVSEVPDIPWTIIIAITSSSTILLGFILIKARYIYIGEEGNTKKTKKR
jgi:PGF-pre-PGF domain-containing protein